MQKMKKKNASNQVCVNLEGYALTIFSRALGRRVNIEDLRKAYLKQTYHRSRPIDEISRIWLL